MVNTYGRTDLAIFTDSDSLDRRPVVLFEFKGPGRPDMVSHDNLNKKAMWELILYYLREEVRGGNTGIKHLVITDCRSYYIFEKKLFYQLFGKNRSFSDAVLKADCKGGDNTDYIYTKLIAPEVEKKKSKLVYTYVNLGEFVKTINKEDIVESRKFVFAYKIFSPTHLLKLPFCSDHNSLNRNFYEELLYIIGVEDMVEKQNHKIVRMKEGRRQAYSLFEQAFSKLDDYETVSNIDEQFDVALGLVLIWVNRILFLKLLESQLINFSGNKEDKFLDIAHVQDYDVLHELFREVLAKPVSERREELKRRFSEVPYLNSSLFEQARLEAEYFSVGALRLGYVDIWKKTVLRDGNGRRLQGRIGALEYLFRFLDAYDFGTEGRGNIVREHSKTIISASVLGLIFEKINGYKDGSFFTPGYITEYICVQTIRKLVVDRFNEVKRWNCKNIEELAEKIDYGKRENRQEANEIINSVRICDPAVGSGHFLVSALNTLIAIKSDLHILQDHSEKPRRIQEYDIHVEDDELVVCDEDGENFRYNPKDIGSQRIQETLFEEKRIIIENCLYGVDLNPKSVEICCLRLWIELLKSAYYYHADDGTKVLQTLPNIDINIKCGNSLVSINPVCVGKKMYSGENLAKEIKEYKDLVRQYKGCRSKAVKKEINRKIQQIKNRLKPQTQMELFVDNTFRKKEHNTLQHALEWMIEFPETLNEDGVFVGFDAIIGNPPYISLNKLKDDAPVYAKLKRKYEKRGKVAVFQTYQTRSDIYVLFVERALQLLRPGGLLSFIIPNKWTKVGYGQPLRQLLLKKNLYGMVDFGDQQIFEDATTYTCIIQMTNDVHCGTIGVSNIHKLVGATLAEDIEEVRIYLPIEDLNDGVWVTSSLENLRKINGFRKSMPSLGDCVGEECYRGILTGLSDAFCLSADKAKSILDEDSRSKNILRPLLLGRGVTAFGKNVADNYLLFIPKGFTVNGMGMDRNAEKMPSEEEAWIWMQTVYPAVAKWLLPFKVQASKRTDKGDYWWEMRACAYYDRFEAPKIFYQAFQTKPCFVYDEDFIFCNNSMFFLSVHDKALLALLNSSIVWWMITEFCPRIQNGYQLVWENFKQIPVPTELPRELSELAESMTGAVGCGDHDKMLAVMSRIDSLVAGLYK